jgi:hypothetical protein
MISIESDKVISLSNNDNEQAVKKLFTQYAKVDSNHLNENEFNSFLEHFLKDQGCQEIFDSIKDENLFGTYLAKDSTQMSFEDFILAFKDVSILAESSKNGGVDVEADFNLEEADLEFY